MATTSIPANCQAVTEQLLVETNRLNGPMYVRGARKRPIIGLQSKTNGAWANGMGFTVGAVTFERAFPALTGDSWTTIAASDGDSVNACRPPSETVQFGETTRTYSPRHYSVNTQDWCVRDIQMGWQFSEFLGNVNKALGDITEWVWYRRYTTDYFTLAGHNLTLNASLASVQDTYGTGNTGYNTSNLATGRLTQSVLDNIYADLYREGGDKANGWDEGTASPVFTLITSMETSRHIVIDAPDIRNDNRWANMGVGNGRDNNNPLMVGLPTKMRNYGGFVHMIDPYPRRFIFTNSTYIEVPPFISSSTTKGIKWEQNAAYKTAPFEESIVWHEDCYQNLMVNTVNNPAPGWNFSPHDWMGQFEPRNILDRTCNQDGDIIYMRALFASAAKPLNPAVGWTILHARCGITIDTNLCYGYPTTA
jgi:hypothetical protein